MAQLANAEIQKLRRLMGIDRISGLIASAGQTATVALADTTASYAPAFPASGILLSVGASLLKQNFSLSAAPGPGSPGGPIPGSVLILDLTTQASITISFDASYGIGPISLTAYQSVFFVLLFTNSGWVIFYRSTSTEDQSALALTSGTAWQNTTGRPVQVDIPVTYSTVNTSVSTLAIAMGTSATPQTLATVSKPIGSVVGVTDVVSRVVPAGQYLMLTATNATIGSGYMTVINS